MSFQSIDTKLEAYKLIHDPTKLISLLYSKYVDIEEDYGLLISNQIIFNRPTHLNLHYKEQKVFFDKTEYLRRFYQKKESCSRILRLNEYYKNYQSFFCKSIISDFFFGNMLKNYQDNKAEIFYKKNYGDLTVNKDEKNDNGTPSLSSLDNVTYNDTIFDKKNKQIIENEDKNWSITLTLDSFRKNENSNLISTCGVDDSFVECLKNIIYYKDKKKELYKIKKEKTKDNNNDLKNLCKKVNEKFKKKINKNEKIIIEKSKENNNSKNLFSILNLGNSLNTPSNEDIKYISKRNKRSSNKSNLFLSPQNNKIYFTNITSRISQFKRQIPINIKYLNRNKSYHFNNNNKNSRIISSNLNINSKNSTCCYSNIPLNEFNLNKGKSANTTKIRNNSNDKSNIINNTNKTNHPKISKYNQFLFSNKNNRNNINIKNKTYELINDANKIKNQANQNILFNHYKKLAQSPRLNRNEIIDKGFRSKYSLFKGGSFSNEFLNEINKQNTNGKFNKKFFVSSNSLENYIHISSLSPKTITKNMNINNDKRRNIDMKKFSNNTCIQNNINIINKIKIQPKYNKNNNNYNINFNNLFFYGANTPSNYLDHIKNNIINNQSKNLNLNRINANFYMLSFNSNNNNSMDKHSRNKNKLNNSQNKKEIKTLNNINSRNLQMIEKEKKYMSLKSNGLNFKNSKNPLFTTYKIGNAKVLYKSKSKEKFKNVNLEMNYNKGK